MRSQLHGRSAHRAIGWFKAKWLPMVNVGTAAGSAIPLLSQEAGSRFGGLAAQGQLTAASASPRERPRAVTVARKLCAQTLVAGVGHMQPLGDATWSTFERPMSPKSGPEPTRACRPKRALDIVLGNGGNVSSAVATRVTLVGGHVQGTRQSDGHPGPTQTNQPPRFPGRFRSIPGKTADRPKRTLSTPRGNDRIALVRGRRNRQHQDYPLPTPAQLRRSRCVDGGRIRHAHRRSSSRGASGFNDLPGYWLIKMSTSPCHA